MTTHFWVTLPRPHQGWHRDDRNLAPWRVHPGVSPLLSGSSAPHHRGWHRAHASAAAWQMRGSGRHHRQPSGRGGSAAQLTRCCSLAASLCVCEESMLATYEFPHSLQYRLRTVATCMTVASGFLLWNYPRTFYGKVQVSSINGPLECQRQAICQHVSQARAWKATTQTLRRRFPGHRSIKVELELLLLCFIAASFRTFVTYFLQSL